MKKFFSLMLAALMLLSLCACGETEEAYQPNIQPEQPDVQQMPDGTGKLTLYADAELQLIYDKSGAVTAVNALNNGAESIVAAYEHRGKACSEAVLELLDLISEQNLLARGYAVIRQESGSNTPDPDFLENIQESAQQNKDSYPVIVVGADELNADGYFSSATALAVMKASPLAAQIADITCSDDAPDGTYSVTCTDAEGNVIQYAVSAVDGAIVVVEIAEQSEPDMTDEADSIPESDIFDPISDIEANEGTDGSVDNGSVDFS